MKGQIPYTKSIEYAAKGIEYVLEISEICATPWFSICTIASLGIVQTVISGILVTTGFGATVGMSFISEGLSDMLYDSVWLPYAYRAYRSRQFAWTDYATQMALSIIISACSAGFSKLKDASKGAAILVTDEACVLAQEAGKEVAEVTATQFVTHAKAVGKEMLKTGKNLKSLAVKCIGVKVAEVAVREGLNSGVQNLRNMSMDLVKPHICNHIQQRVTSKFCNLALNSLLRKMFALDSVVRYTN